MPVRCLSATPHRGWRVPGSVGPATAMGPVRVGWRPEVCSRPSPVCRASRSGVGVAPVFTAPRTDGPLARADESSSPGRSPGVSARRRVLFRDGMAHRLRSPPSDSVCGGAHRDGGRPNRYRIADCEQLICGPAPGREVARRTDCRACSDRCGDTGCRIVRPGRAGRARPGRTGGDSGPVRGRLVPVGTGTRGARTSRSRGARRHLQGTGRVLPAHRNTRRGRSRRQASRRLPGSVRHIEGDSREEDCFSFECAVRLNAASRHPAGYLHRHLQHAYAQLRRFPHRVGSVGEPSTEGMSEPQPRSPGRTGAGQAASAASCRTTAPERRSRASLTR